MKYLNTRTALPELRLKLRLPTLETKATHQDVHPSVSKPPRLPLTQYIFMQSEEEIYKVSTRIGHPRIKAAGRHARPTPGVEPAPQRAVPTDGGDVGALMARLWMPQTHIYDRHT